MTLRVLHGRIAPIAAQITAPITAPITTQGEDLRDRDWTPWS
jgi:hypothetical protein